MLGLEAEERVPAAVAELEGDMIGGRDDSDGIPTVLKTPSDVLMLAVASGPTVIGKPTMAQSSAKAENVAKYCQCDVAVTGRTLLEPQSPGHRLTCFLCCIACVIYTRIRPVDIHLILTKTRPRSGAEVTR